MQHITTKSSHHEHGRKVYARASGGKSVRLGWDHGLSDDGNHKAALRELCRRLDWSYDWYASPVKNGGYVWVSDSSDVLAFTVGANEEKQVR